MNKINAIVIILMILGLLALPIFIILFIWGLIESNLLFKLIITDIVLLFSFCLIMQITDYD